MQSSGDTEKLRPIGRVCMSLHTWCGLHRHKVWCLFQGLVSLWCHALVHMGLWRA